MNEKATTKLSDAERQPCEVWRAIKGYEGRYEVSNLGRIKSCAFVKRIRTRWGGVAEQNRKEKLLRPWSRGSGRALVDLWRDGRRDVRTVYALVYEAFVGEIPEGFFIHHIDGDCRNNIASNLEAMSALEHNRLHHGGRPSWNKGLHTGNQYTRRKHAEETRDLEAA